MEWDHDIIPLLILLLIIAAIMIISALDILGVLW